MVCLFPTSLGLWPIWWKEKGVIEFENFIHALSIFHPYAPLEDKINCKNLIAKVINLLLHAHIKNCHLHLYISVVAFRLYDRKSREPGDIEREVSCYVLKMQAVFC